ncbi:hypothetical protein RFM98_13160 [Mesorhizobium sp. VK9D]|uniref:hypothetical protein n=1 Tax=Mesorhizobium australafricanum TaxID=3072311 RepID=UPI002A2421AD|nr:hypothetical protein [Mesorhizobium sp. VK9D]MDX8453709.1 hypothetical protein [Mesorhizobium sp. VK9D]
MLSHPDLRGNPRVRAFSDFSAKWLRTRLNAGAQGPTQPAIELSLPAPRCCLTVDIDI